MRILHLTNSYNNFLRLTSINEALSFQENEEKFYSMCFSWADFWVSPMAKKGVEFWQITANNYELQRLWARDFLHDNPAIQAHEIIIAQVSHFQPDILLMDEYNEGLLNEIRVRCKSIKLVATWTGSALAPMRWIKKVDLTLSCAPESVERLRSMGFKAEHMDHMFAPIILDRLKNLPARGQEKATFIGQLLPGSDFHRARIKLVSSLVPLGLKVFAPRWEARSHLSFLKAKLFGKNIDFNWMDYFRIHRAMMPPCFGLEMYSTLAQSNVTFNVHADSSPKFASNMRLFEATGTGTCLLTDWKGNIRDLFEPDYEIVTYSSADECKEKLQFLIQNPAIAHEIGKKGQARCLADHNVDRRADKMLEIFRKYL